MTSNRALHAASIAQQDEFYTQFTDVQEELGHYWEHFRGAKILCNCDDPFESSFFRYLALQFAYLGIKKLTATCYAGSPIAQQQLSLFEEDTPAPKRKPYCATITDYRDWNGDGRTDLLDVRYMLEHQIGCTVRVLQGDGDFRSPECVELLKDADIVITNPPFSLFREFVALMMEHNKKFLILGNKNAVTYKEIFPLIQQGKMWLGHRNMNSDFWLEVPSYENYEKTDEQGRRLKHIMACWYTNLPITKRHEFLTLLYPYTPEEYPRYDNYDAIEVSRTDRIPMDYDGVMGVPITFLDKYCPSQFEIVGCTYAYGDPGCHVPGTTWNARINGRDIYKRLFIRKKQYDENGSFYVVKHYGPDGIE